MLTAARPPLLYDYYGFPPAAYTLTWPAPGAPDLALRVAALLAEAGIPTAIDPVRGFDHGTVFVVSAWQIRVLPTVGYT